MSFSYQGCRGSGVSPTFLQTDTWSEDSVSAGNPERSDNARPHRSHISAEPFQTWRRFGPLAAAHTRLMEESRRVRSSRKQPHEGAENTNEELKVSDCCLLTGALLAGVREVVVAGYVAPASIVVPHHHHTVFTGEKIAVWLPSVPVLIQLKQRDSLHLRI